MVCLYWLAKQLKGRQIWRKLTGKQASGQAYQIGRLSAGAAAPKYLAGSGNCSYIDFHQTGQRLPVLRLPDLVGVVVRATFHQNKLFGLCCSLV